VSFVLLCSFAGGVEPFLPPLEEPVICELCVWELLCSILSTMCGSRTGGWSLPCVMSD
jgi:hypothetical protein